MKILAIIPARGGSKGIPGKNIVNLAGKPLITYTIDSAKKSKLFDKIIVSTDDNKIAKIAKLGGAEVPFLRPKKISQDKSSTLDVVKHTLRFLSVYQSYMPDIIVILQPTSPLRTTEMIDESIMLLKKSNASCVITVSKVKTHPFGSFWLKNNFLRPFSIDFKKYSQRQKYPELYYPTGAIYTFWHKTLEKYDSIYGPKIKPIMMENEIDIDNIFDLFICEMKILNWNNYRKKFHFRNTS